MPDANTHAIAILTQALRRTDPAVRTGYLDGACGDDTDLRGRVEALLATHGGAGRFPEHEPTTLPEATSSPDVDATSNFDPETRPPSEQTPGQQPPGGTQTAAEDTPPGGPPDGSLMGQVIAGRYRLIGVLGEGGMGTVYRAEQSQPVRRPVALKLIRVGLDSRAVLARFDAERQALALMDHPNIARVYDGGTTAAGQPFFAMELVSGAPITDYCDLKRLPLRARLELFVAVCQAVQHAHQKGIIHRDLKPSNVLVTEVDGRPTPKVIDFGVAKATEFSLTDLSLADTGAIVGTPTYMSPEQADPSSMDIDTRTDIYALGVILYELLAGSPPIDAKSFKRAGFLEMLRTVREVEPPSPSTRLSKANDLPGIAANRGLEPAQLRRALRGDLDWIVLKALEKDRTRRYETANSFAADVMRHLASEPVLAAPPGRAYRARKFARKHRGAVVAAGLVVFTLVAGIIGTTIGLIAADARRREAERNLAFATRGNEILGSIFEGLDPKANYATVAEFSGALRDGLNKAVRELDGAPIGDPLVVAAMQDKLGQSLFALGEAPGAIVVLKKSLETRKLKLGTDHPDTLQTMHNLGSAYLIARKLDVAIPLLEQTIKLRKVRLGADHPDTVSSTSDLALAYTYAGKLDLAIPLHEETLELQKARLGADHPDTVSNTSNLALAYTYAGKLDQAVPLHVKTLELWKARLGPDHPDTLLSMNNLAMTYEKAGKLDQAIALHEEVLRLQKAKLGLDHPDTIRSMNNLALAYTEGEKLNLAIPLHEEALKLWKAKLGPDHPDTLIAMNNLALACAYAGTLDRAIALHKETLKLRKAKLGPDHPDTLRSMNNLASAYSSAGKLDLAVPLYEETFKLRKAKLGPDSPRTLMTMASFGLSLLKSKAFNRAEPLLRECLAIREKAQPADWQTFETESLLGEALLGQKKYADAEAYLRQGYEGMKKRETAIPARNATVLPKAIDRLIELETARDRPDEIKKWQAERAKYPQAAFPPQKKT
jgi:eukaryotic-like serine/threonine-protein kinase